MIVNLMLGTDVAKATTASVARAARPERARETPALEVKGLSHGHALRDVSFRVDRGEVLGVAALEGQGQEELFDCIAGVRRADAGEVIAEGRALKLRHPADAIRAGLVLVPANRLVSLLPQRSVQENVALAAFGRLKSGGPLRSARRDAGSTPRCKSSRSTPAPARR
jgi:ribose transport system ATP-binding protein